VAESQSMEALGTIVAWLIPIAIIVGTILAFSAEKDRKRRRTEAEYQKDLESARGSLIGAGVAGFQKILASNEKIAAIESLKDEEQGVTKTGDKGDDKDRTQDK
jgi:hypothetical protein